MYLLAALLTSMATSTRSSYVLSAIGGVLVFNFFFTTPKFSLRVYEHGAPLTFLIMIVAALIVGTLTDRLKSQVKQSTQAAYRTNLLFETSQMLQRPPRTIKSSRQSEPRYPSCWTVMLLSFLE